MTAQLSLALVRTNRTRLHAKYAAQIAALVPVAHALATKAGPAGITVGNLRLAANLPTVTGGGRGYAWLATVLRRAGLHNTRRRRMSPLPGTRNDNAVYVLPEYR